MILSLLVDVALPSDHSYATDVVQMLQIEDDPGVFRLCATPKGSTGS